MASYRRAADFLNVNRVDVLSLQHEYGIFGGKAGAHLLAMIRELRMPIAATLHTLLTEPNAAHPVVMGELVQLSTRLIVMSAAGAGYWSTSTASRRIGLIPASFSSAISGCATDRAST